MVPTRCDIRQGWEPPGAPPGGYILHPMTQSADSSAGLVAQPPPSAPARVGWFRYYFADQRWEWSPQIAQMHGYQPGAVTPTTALVLSHKHPDDRAAVAAAIAGMGDAATSFSTRHRIVDVRGDVHQVVVVGDELAGDDGVIVGAQGFYVDVTPLLDRARDELVTEAVAEIAEAWGVIEQVKGMLMLIYRIDADAAFELLKWRSQEANVKLRLIAEQLAADFGALDYGSTLPPRVVFDRLLLTAHVRAVGKP